MKFIFLAIILVSSNGLHAEKDSPDYYLTHKISTENRRYHTFYQVLQLMQERNVRTILETGTSRCGTSNYEGDGGSTIIYAQWAKDYGAELYSVDFSEDNLYNAKKAVQEQLCQIPDEIHFVCSDSITFLQGFGKTIDLLYLDSCDYDIYNPLISQMHHLYEIQAAFPHLTHNSIVMIDDCDLPNGGKGKLVIEYLQERGWQIFQSAYQVILIYPN